MRGKKISKQVLSGGIAQDLRKGRSNSLIGKRNDCLLARYYYYAHFRDKPYEETVSLLAKEFFLAPVTIINIILENTENIQMLKTKAKTLAFFNIRWQHMKWS